VVWCTRKHLSPAPPAGKEKSAKKSEEIHSESKREKLTKTVHCLGQNMYFGVWCGGVVGGRKRGKKRRER